jgi:glycosyltransferase involved in cell wall biosynthesis
VASEHGRPGCAPVPHTLVLVGPVPPPSGGMANQTAQLAKLLAAEGCEVRLVQTNRPCPVAWIERIRGLRAVVRLVPYACRLWRVMARADIAHVMANSGWAWHLFAAPAVWIAKLRGVPAVVNYRGGNAAAFLQRENRLVRPTISRAAAVIVPSGFLQTVFARHAIATGVVRNVVNLEAFVPPAARPPHPHLVITRNLEEIYDIGTAIRAFAKVRKDHAEARMTIAGSGPERPRLEALAAEEGVLADVRFTGRLDISALPALYQSASVLVNPSRIDNAPNSLLEALASGVPIVSTNVGGVPYMVENERTALLVPPGDAAAMAGAICRVLDEPGLAESLALAGRACIAAHAWEQVRPALLETYARACMPVLAGESGK